MPDLKLSSEVRCANADCHIAESGRCIEGLPLDECPHYDRDRESYADEDAADLAEAKADSVALPSAGPLTVAEASAVLQSDAARVIAVIGPTDSGKTSLIASLYDLFQDGPVNGYEFARSRTFHAFEQTCHDARTASRRGAPHMSRTPRGNVSFYHLAVCGGGPDGVSLSFLIADRAGEEYRESSDDVAVVAGFAEIARADTITVLVDGERLLSGARHNLRSDITMLLQGMHDGGGIRAGVRLALVLTKIDAIRASPEAPRATRDFATLASDVRRLFGGALGPIELFEVAASPKTDAAPRGTGVGALLSFWAAAAEPIPAVDVDSPPYKRAFARLRPVEDEPGDEA